MIHSADQWVSHVKEYSLKLIYCLFKLGQIRETHARQLISLLIGTNRKNPMHYKNKRQ